jgi:hypothetical protein
MQRPMESMTQFVFEPDIKAIGIGSTYMPYAYHGRSGALASLRLHDETAAPHTS